jgi:dTDP-4-amino-4,6-dideoxygalactose transaminase
MEFLVGRPNIGVRSELQERFSRILEKNWLTNNGPFVREFEAKFAKQSGARHCIVVTNGTVAIELVVKALGLTGEVIIPSFTFIATAHALQWHGVKPVFCDIDPTTFCIDPAKAESLLTPETSAIMGVHVYGRACDVEALDHIASANDIPLIFDAAHAVGCTQGGQPIGSFGTCEIFSFHATKVLNSIEGGAITTNDDELAERFRRLRNFGFPGDGRDVTTELGTNAKMNEFCAAMGLTNLESLFDFIAVNQSNSTAYREGLAGISGIRVFEFDSNEENNHQYVIALVDEDEFGYSRDALMEALHGEGILARRYFYPGCHAMEPYVSLYPDAVNGLPVTEVVSQQVLALPTGTQLVSTEVQEICEFIGDFQANR